MISIPYSRFKAFKPTTQNQRWGQAFHDYMEFDKVTDAEDKVWCDRLYNAGFNEAQSMVYAVMDYNN